MFTSMRFVAGNLKAVHHPPVMLFVERQRAVHRAAVVPDDEIADAPAVPVREPGLRGEIAELAHQRVAFGFRDSHDGAAVLLASDVECALAGFRMRADDR